jgi:hypothetical protein
VSVIEGRHEANRLRREGEAVMLVCCVKRLTSILSVAAAVLLVGCGALWESPSDQPLPSTPTLDFQKITTPNLEPGLSSDPIAYRVGAWWRYRDATADHRPTHHPGPNLLVEVLGAVVAADGTELYVLYQEAPDDTEGLYYVHRDSHGVLEHGRNENTGPIVPANPVRAIDLPFAEEKQWTYRIAQQTYEADCLFPETLTLHSGVFLNCWKIGVRNVTTGETKYYWFKNGVGLLKIVSESLSYELIDASTTETSAVHQLQWKDSLSTIEIKVGDRLVVQLPAEDDSGYAWKLDSYDPGIVSPLGNGRFLADLDGQNARSSGTSGTFVMQLESVSHTLPGMPMTLQLMYVPAWDKMEPAYTFTLWLVVSQ